MFNYSSTWKERSSQITTMAYFVPLTASTALAIDRDSFETCEPCQCVKFTTSKKTSGFLFVLACRLWLLPQWVSQHPVEPWKSKHPSQLFQESNRLFQGVEVFDHETSPTLHLIWCSDSLYLLTAFHRKGLNKQPAYCFEKVAFWILSVFWDALFAVPFWQSSNMGKYHPTKCKSNG